ncbi:MAG: NADPH:quinone reductase [Aestuariivita sp.]|uniref:NADPH:quinone reductase n=1 Tax=Aestuariivita sp. TaxID=1872407 RepID=UPI003BAF4AF8
MRAIIYSAFGAARDVLREADLDSPAPGPGEVRVALSYSGVNPSDVKARSGNRPGVLKPPYPQIIPHSDGAGVITALGEGVPETRMGERVWIWNGQWRRGFGTCAEDITLPTEQAVTLPDSVDLETGAVLGIPGLTACHTVFNGGPVAGKTVLVQGAAGTVGYLAVQLALWGGARVIATARGAGADRLRALGVDRVVDFTQPDLASAILEANAGTPIDRIIEPEFGLNIATNAAVIAENGSLCAYGSALEPAPVMPFMPLMFKAVTLEMALIYIQTWDQRQACIARLHEALTEGALVCPVQEVFELSQTAAAHQAVEAGHRNGAILVKTARA